MAAERAEAAAGGGGGGGAGGGGGGDLPPYAGWTPAELQATLAGIGAPAQGTREELVERLQAYTMQTGIVLSRPVLRPEEGDKAAQPPLPAQGQHPFGDKAKEQELLEQQKRAAVLLEQERQQEMAKLAPAVPRPPP
ncbi:splicing factor 3B subunit 2 [Aquila chrysaetos chrysaetos]|uniref:splicing factor 3B subunit 2 n=1 Tax=Aquila chrysaetos chrysaetos TaxID=223781 RepID=UPI001B7D417C|nr:splicing factor 3B subunit 2 [Aquila chrysaetos chrysaetos]